MLAIGVVVAGNVIAIDKIRKSGGFVKVAKLLLSKGNAVKKAKAFLAIVGEIAGVQQIIKQCT